MRGSRSCNCGTRYTELGCRVTELSLYHCPECGTLRLCDGTELVPLRVQRAELPESGVTGEQSANTGYDKRLPATPGSAVSLPLVQDRVLSETPWIAVPPLTGEWLPDHLG